MRRLPFLVLLMVLPLACTKPGPAEGRRRCVHYKQDVRPVLEARCVSCHSGNTPAGAYDLTAYNAVLGNGSDGVANAVAGNPESTLLRQVAPDTANAAHQPVTDVHDLLEEWVVDCQLSLSAVRMHEPGIANPADDAFHGKQLRANSYNMDGCTNCHGVAFEGGKAGVSCLDCHREGPTGCSSCHAQPPQSGAHQLHFTAAITNHPLTCASCHTMPTDWRQPGHVLLGDGGVDPYPAEVNFGPEASRDVHPEFRVGPPAFDGNTCSNVGCHGETLGPSSTRPAPFEWQPPTGQRMCARCHALPPASHGSETNCSKCHGQVVNADNTWANASKHLDGTLQVGTEDQSCTACHQNQPFTNTLGSQDIRVMSVGAHDSHLQAPNQMSGKVTCQACHLTPDRVGAPGHLDSDRPAEVFAFATDAPGLAAARGASPVFNPASGGCSNVYCHGGGAVGSQDPSPTIHRTPLWQQAGLNTVLCGSCHGIPPVDSNHTPDMTSLGCTQCHPGSVDQFGRIIVRPDGTSDHINGVANAIR